MSKIIPKELKCDECGTTNTYNIAYSKKIECCSCQAVIYGKEKTEMNNDWKDLEIGNIPSDFFVNDRYEVDTLILEGSTDRMEDSLITGVWQVVGFKPKDRNQIITHLSEGVRYRYRLKELQSIKIPAWLNHLILENIPSECFDLFYWDAKTGLIIEMNGQSVEIIEE